MTFKKIVGFGDSWMWGDELIDPALADHPHRHPILIENTQYRESNCFLGQLGKHYDLPTENFGWPGGSLQSTIWCYLWWLKHTDVDPQDCIILVALTDANRQSFYNPMHKSYANDPPWNRFVHSAWVHSGNNSNGDEWVDMVRKHMVLTDCPEVNKLNWQQTVWFFEGQSRIHGENVLQFATRDVPMTITGTNTLLWPDTSLHYLLNEHEHRDQNFCEHGHPSEFGHLVISKMLIDSINRVIITR